MARDFSAELFGSPTSGQGTDFSKELFGSKPKERTYGEAATDIGAGVVSGLGSLVQLPGQLYGLATGNFDDTGLLGLGKSISKSGEEMKSEALKQREEQRAQKIAEAEQKGTWEAFKTAAGETIKDPALLTSFLAEQVPQMIIPFGAGKAGSAIVAGRQALAGATAKEAALAGGKAGVTTAIGAGGVQQGADVGAQSYEDIYKYLVKDGTPPDQAKSEALNLARASGAGALVISLLAQRLPGAKTLEESFVGVPGVGGKVARIGKGIAGETGSEIVEEGGGKIGQNIAMRQVNPEQSLMEGVGATAGLAAVGGVGMGGIGGALQRAPQPTLPKTPETKTTTDKLLSQSQLLLPAPDEQIINDKQYDPLRNPLGNFLEGELTPEQIAYINKDRSDNNKPRLNSYSLEDYVDALRHSSDTDVAKQGALDNILTFKTGYDGMVETTVDQVLNAALDKNIETGTQGFKDFLTRSTGTDNLEIMSPVQLYSAYEALVSPNVPRSDTLQILPEGTNATRFTQKQYDQALNNLQAEYNFLDTDSLGRTSVINDIKDTTGLKDDTDAKALLRHAINRGDLEERISTAKVDGKDVNVVNIAFAGKSEPLPSGFDIRYQTFKQGAVPENYEIKNGSVVLDRVGTEEEAKVALEKQTAIAEKKALDIEKDIEKIQSGVDRLEYSLDEKKTLGHFGTPAYNRMATDIGAQIRQAKDRINAKLNDIRNLRNPFAIVPVGEKPVTAKKYVFYDNDTPLASFANKDLAEQYGLMRQNAKGEYAVTDETLQQIIDSAPTTKGTLPKRYASYAKKELARRKGEAPQGIEVRKSMYQPKVEEDFDKIRQNLLPALKKFGLEKVGLRIVKSIADGKADGSYVQELIKIAYNAKNPMGTLRHEVIHALKELGAFTQQEWKILENKAKSEWIDKYIKKVGTYKAYQDAYKQSNGDLKGFDEYIAEEAIAEAFRDFANTKPPVGLIGNLFFRLNKMFEALGNTFKRLGYATAGDIFQKVERGEAKPTRVATSTQEKLSRQKQPISDEEYFAQETARPKAKKVIFEVAPDPNNKDLTERWNSLSSEEKLVISKKVADYVVKDALETFDSEGKISDQIGSYGEFTNPSLSLFVDSGDSIEIAKYLGYALSQDSMVVISPRDKKGFDKTGAVVIDVGNKNEKEIDDIYQTLRAINLNGENPVGGQSTINGKMVVLNYSNSTTQDLAIAIDDALKQKYNVATNEVYTAFPEKKDYDYGDKTNDPRGIGRVVRERSRAIRSEAAALIESELKQVGKGKAESASSGINILDKRVDNPNLEKPTVNDVGKYFDGLYDKKRDFSDVEDFNRAVKIATEEIAYQLENERSGLDWYDEDISKAFKLTAKIIPKLKQSNSRFLFSVMAGIMSPQTNARDNWVIAAQNFQNYIKTGTISGVNPQTGGLWQGGTQSINKQKQLDLLNNMVQDMGEKGAIAWLVSNRTVKEINDFRMKYGNIKSGIGGKMTDIVPALYTFGPKVGPFVSNLNGIYDVTVDKWMTRTFNRYFGTMLGKDKNIIDAPTEKQRTAIKNLINEVAKDANIKPYQAQSLLWFFEQRLFRELGTPSPSYGFGDGARKFSEQTAKGGDRGGVEGDGKNKPATQTGLEKGELLQIRAPETKEFKQWFGDSEVVDNDGNPLVVYHGTGRDFTEFSKDLLGASTGAPSAKLGFFFAGDPDTSNKYAENAQRRKVSYGNPAEEEISYLKDDIRKYKKEIETYKLEKNPDTEEGQRIRDYLKNISLKNIEKDKQSLKKDPDNKFLLQRIKIDPTPTEEYVEQFLDKEIKYKTQDLTKASKRIEELSSQLSSKAKVTNEGRRSGQNIMPVFLSLQNPLVIDQGFSSYRLVSYLDTIKKAQRDGNDGVIIKNTYDGKAQPGWISKLIAKWRKEDVPSDTIYIAFEPTQIKSATGNKGTFDKTNPDIRYQIRAPETEEFQEWIGDSVAIDKNGDPIVFYHGTDQDIESFRASKEGALGKGIYITPNAEYAGNYTEESQFGDKRGTGANVIPLYARVEFPLVIKYKRGFDPAVQALEVLGLSNDKAASIVEKAYEDKGNLTNEIMSRAKKVGHDAIFYMNEDGSIREAVVFNPNQIKSVFNQKPTASKDIRYQIRNIMDEVDPDINSRVGATTRVREEKGFVERLVDAISPTSFAKYRQAFVNKYEAIELLSRQVAREHGSDRLLANTSAIAAALQSDRAAGVAAASFKQGIPVYRDGFFTVDPDTKGLIPILEPLMAYNDPYIFQLFQYYGATRRGKRLDAEGRERTFTKEDIAYGDKLEKQFPEFKQVFNEYQTYNKGLVDLMVDRGVITKEEGRIWTQNWDYIPFYRQMDGETTAGPKVFSSFTAVAKPKELKGAGYYSVLDANGQEIGKYLDPIIAQKKADEANGTVEQVGAPITDFLETVVRNARAAIEASMKNEAGNRIIRDTLEMGLAQEVPLGTNDSAREIVTIKQDGKNKYFRVADPLLYESLKGLNTPQMQWLSWLAAPANLLRNFVTKDPGFMIANLGRDSLQAWITSGTDMRPVIDTFKQFSKTLTNSSPEAQALALAGLTGYDFSGDVKGTSKGVAKELRKMAGQKTKLESLTTFWDMLEQGSHASDMATRAEIYKRTLERTKSPEFPNGNEAEAFYQAMEVLNFSRKGNSAIIQIVSAVVPFFNARVQGLDVLYRSGWGRMATENADVQKKAFANRALIMMGLSMAYWFMMTDSDEYKKLSKEERDNYWIIPALSINDKPFRFPIPFELGVVFKVLPERVLEAMFGNDTGKDLRESIFRNMTNTLQFNPIPQAFIPIVENVTNHSFFTGENIVGRGMEDLAPQFQYTQSTSQFAKDIGATLGSSPIKIENLIRGYTGTMGTYALQMLDAVYRTQGDDVRASMRLEQMPVIKRFFSGDSGTISAYYDLKQEVNTVVRTLNLLEKSGDIDAYMDYMKENGSLYNMRGYINTIDKNMKQVREARKYINDAKGLSPDEKREQLDSLHDIEISLTENIKQLRKDYR
jgi:hypothetical protein